MNVLPYVEMPGEHWNFIQLQFQIFEISMLIELAIIVLLVYNFRYEISETKFYMCVIVPAIPKAVTFSKRAFNFVFPYGNWRWYVVFFSYIVVDMIALYTSSMIIGTYSYRSSIGDPVYAAYPMTLDPLMDNLFGWADNIFTVVLLFLFASLSFDALRLLYSKFTSGYKYVTEWGGL